MDLITHTIKGNDGHTAYVLTDYGRGKFGLANQNDEIHVWLTEAAYGEVLDAIRNHNDPLQACKDAENAELERQFRETCYARQFNH